jgi:pyruvate formate lyase activating enzyme
MKIGGLQKVSLIDYPGKISAVIFLQGCNFRCPYCHNPELVDPQRFEAALSEDDLFRFLDTRRGKLDGVSITGGEPTIHNDLSDFVRHIKDMGFLVKLDTNGSSPDVLQRLIDEKLLDYIAMDIKGPLKKYETITRVRTQPEVLLKSIGMIMNSGIAYEFRTTAVKPLLTKKDFPVIVKLIEKANRYVIQKFTPSKALDESFLAKKSFDDDELQSVKTIIEGNVSQLIIR